jgi:transposase
MSIKSKLLTKEIVEFAESSLKDLGKTGAVAIKLRAIIAADKYGITHVAKVFDTTKATLISWIKAVKSESVEPLKVQAGRGRKRPLTDAQEVMVYKWIEGDSQITIDQLKQKIMSELNLEISRSSVHRIIKKLKFSYITARAQHYKQDVAALPEAKKNLIEKIKELPENRLLFMDEARFGTHSKQGHGWFPTGKRSRVAVKLGFKNFYVYSSIEPKTGEVFSLILPQVNTEMKPLHNDAF